MKNRTALAAAAVALVAGGALAVVPASADPTAQAVTVAYAKVAANGTILQSSNITGINKFGGGRYNLFTNFDVGHCALTGSLNTGGGSDPGPGNSSILIGAVNNRTLFVRTSTPPSVYDDRPLSVLITC